jgi:hypothetical protein
VFPADPDRPRHLRITDAFLAAWGAKRTSTSRGLFAPERGGAVGVRAACNQSWAGVGKALDDDLAALPSRSSRTQRWSRPRSSRSRSQR